MVEMCKRAVHTNRVEEEGVAKVPLSFSTGTKLLTG